MSAYEWKPAYLVHGDDHGRIAERRARMRASAQAVAGASGLEVLEGDAAAPAAVAAALGAMTFALGRRFVLVEGVQGWKEADAVTHVVPALATLAPDTTVAFFAREDGRQKAPAALHKAVARAGGAVFAHVSLKAKDLPDWVIAEAQRLGLTLDNTAARALVGQVGERQQRLLRELEKLALEYGPATRLDSAAIEDAAAASADHQVWGLVDATVARRRGAAIREYLELTQRGESLGRLVPLIAKRLREVLAIATRLDGGESPTQVKASLKMSPWAAGRRVEEARGAELPALRRALVTLAQLELDTRGMGDLAHETAAIRALGRMTG